MILSVFCARRIRIVGPSAAARAAVPAVVTNSRRSNPFRLVMDLASTGFKKRVLGVGCRAFTAPAPDTQYPAPSQRVQHAQCVLVCGAHACAPPSHRPEILEPERVAAGPEPDQCVSVVTQLAEQRPAILLP